MATSRKRKRRILTRRGSSSCTGQFNTAREKKAPSLDEDAYDSRPEFLVLGILDADPTVLTFEPQPETFELPDGRSYTPDIRIVYKSGDILYVDVKLAAAFAKNPDFDGKLADIMAAAEARGATFEVWTEAFFKCEMRLRNAALLRHSLKRSPALEKDMVRELLYRGALAIEEIERELSIGDDGRFAALALCAEGKASFDHTREIDFKTTVIRLNRGS